MPEEKIWANFFDVEEILDALEINDRVNNLIEFGFGYGTFTIPSSKRINGTLYAFDIEKALTENLTAKLKLNNIRNVKLLNKDFISEGSGLQNEEADYVMLFNILHAEESPAILNESFRILKTGAKVGVIHWNYDPTTPRGPGMHIRPKPEELKSLLVKSAFSIIKYPLDFPPYHYGILAQK
ncbi:MAG TPA: methyltransferase domain-containing protein [Ignavibacteriaceae bacterium]|nr:methyltransferase domain-containing protein [Ignavibacteriaceae bacterium]